MNRFVASDAARALMAFVPLAAAFLYLPFIVLLLFCVFAAWGRSRNLRWLFLLAALLLFGTLNTTKQVDGDLINYVNTENYLTGQSVLVLLNTGEMHAVAPTYRVTEVGFYGTQWLLAQVFDNASAALAVLGTLLIYVPTFAAILMLGRIKGWNNRLTIIVALVAFFAAINFINTTHLLRQYISSSFGLLALASYFDRRKLAATAWGLLACSVHNGTAYLIGCFVVVALLFPLGRPFWRWGSVWRVLCAGTVLCGSVALMWLHGIIGLTEVSDITVWRYVVAAVVFGVFYYFTKVRGFDRVDYYLSVAFLIVMFVSTAFFVMNEKVLALRYFVYTEWLYAPMLANILCAVPRRHLVAYLGSRWLVSCAAACVFILRVTNPPGGYIYGPESRQVLTISAREAIAYIGT
jgi:hypothetical protein